MPIQLPARACRVVAFILSVGFIARGFAATTSFTLPVSYEVADRRAGELLAQLTIAEKLELISGYRTFYIRGFPRLGIPQLGMTDATQGVRLRPEANDQLKQSVAFPAPIGLAATWNPELAYRYAHAIGEECRAAGVAFLLGPGMNIYRVSQCGRNFEYFGEDPFLAARMVERYVRGVLDTGTVPTLKHFVANNTDFHRRTSNSLVDERALHEIYLPAFQAGIDAGAMAVMTSYNLLNGEWCGQSRHAITDLLRGSLGFKWLVMTDWGSVFDTEKIVKSGQDLEMPGDGCIARDAAKLLADGKVTQAEIDRMARSILRTCIAMGLHDRPVKDERFLAAFSAHEQVALETAHEGIVLLKNDGILPLRKAGEGKILVTGLFAERLAHGGGSGYVDGYNNVTLKQALADTYDGRAEFVAEPSDEQLKAASAVVLSTGTWDSEGWDRPFALPDDEERQVLRVVALNPHTIVVVNSGGGVQMTDWRDRAAAIVYAWYPGQIGNRALADVLCGATNPSGKLPITIERKFEDSPGRNYVPSGQQLYTGWNADGDLTRAALPVEYREGVLVGYRWYDTKKIAPLFAFGSGLSYSTFAYANARVAKSVVARDENVAITCAVSNTGKVPGAEVVQVYVRSIRAPVERPEKELKGFAKVQLGPGEARDVTLTLAPRDFAYWDVTKHDWVVAPGEYEVLVGGASDRIALRAKVTLR